MTIPSSVISVLHIPIIMLQRIAIMPFIIMQQPIMPLAFIMQSCWSIMAAVLRS